MSAETLLALVLNYGSPVTWAGAPGDGRYAKESRDESGCFGVRYGSELEYDWPRCVMVEI